LLFHNNIYGDDRRDGKILLKQEVPSKALIPYAALFAEMLDADCASFGIKVLP